MSRPQLAQFVGEGEGKGRQYKHPFRLGGDKKPLASPSITTVLKLVDKSSLAQWSADLTAKWCSENWETLGSRSEDRAFNVARFRWKDVRDERAFVGTGIHDTIEAEHLGLWDYPMLDAEQLLIMEEWRKLNEIWLIEPILSEFTVWNFTHDYAGTGDGLWRFTNRLTGETFVALVDIKTSKSTWPEHRMQLSALCNGEVLMEKVNPDAEYKNGKWPEGSWVEREMPEFDKALLVHLRAPEFNEWGHLTKEGKHDLIEVERELLPLWFEEFCGYRALRATQDKRKALEKKMEAASYGGF